MNRYFMEGPQICFPNAKAAIALEYFFRSAGISCRDSVGNMDWDREITTLAPAGRSRAAILFYVRVSNPVIYTLA